MPRLTIYAKDRDAALWARAKAESADIGESLSEFIAKAISGRIKNERRKRGLPEHIE